MSSANSCVAASGIYLVTSVHVMCCSEAVRGEHACTVVTVELMFPSVRQCTSVSLSLYLYTAPST